MAPGSLSAQLTLLRRRLDRLREGLPPELSLLERARAALEREIPRLRLPLLDALDLALDQVGIHTSADARLLRDLGVEHGRSAPLSSGLSQRAEAVVWEFDGVLRQTERATQSRSRPAGALALLEVAWVKLARAVKVAALFSESTTGSRWEIYAESRPDRRPPPKRAVVAIAEFWSDRARRNFDDVAGRQRELNLAHELLLGLSNDQDRERLLAVRLEVTSARERVKSEKPFTSIEQLTRSVRSEGKHDPASAYRRLRGLYDRAVEAGNEPVAQTAREALEVLLPSPEALREAVGSRDVDRVRDFLGESVRASDARAAEETPPSAPDSEELLANLLLELDSSRMKSFEMAASCGPYFDVDEVLSSEEEVATRPSGRTRLRRVPYPTPLMSYDYTGTLADLAQLVVSDPRTLLYDLASNRQLVRTYLEPEMRPRPRVVRKTAVRVYVLDASGSMFGQRAHFRDALLLSELNNLRRKAREGKPFDALYFCFFNDRPTDLARVDSAAEAARQMQKLLSHSPAEGQTDISLALMTAFDSIRSAQGRDPQLARAKVVLVTDGEDAVDLELVRRSRAPIGSLNIDLSFISLGEENRDLKALAEEQRAQGSRGFYQSLSDAELTSVRSEFDSRWRTLLPETLEVSPEQLEQLLPNLEALEKLAAGLRLPAAVRAEGSFDALFPDLERKKRGASGNREGEERVADILEAIGEAAPLASRDRRATESLALLEHLLEGYGLTLPDYLAVLQGAGPRVAGAVERIRLVCRPLRGRERAPQASAPGRSF